MYQEKLLDQIKSQQENSRNDTIGFRPNTDMGELSPSKEMAFATPTASTINE